MSLLFPNPEGRFSRVEAHIFSSTVNTKGMILLLQVKYFYDFIASWSCSLVLLLCTHLARLGRADSFTLCVCVCVRACVCVHACVCV